MIDGKGKQFAQVRPGGNVFRGLPQGVDFVFVESGVIHLFADKFRLQIGRGGKAGRGEFGFILPPFVKERGLIGKSFDHRISLDNYL